MTQKASMDSDLVDWKEAFLFFYWDLKKLRANRTKEGYIADRLIVEFFQQTKPTMAYEGPDMNWNWTLYRLMRALRAQHGFHTAPETTTFSYNWLSDTAGPSHTKAPFVDWVRLETQTHLLFTYANSTIDRFLAHLVTEIYGPLHQWTEWTLHNPFLVEFQRAHGIQPWSVPLPLPGASEDLDQIAWPDAPVLASGPGPAHSRPRPVRFSISVASINGESDRGVTFATLTLPDTDLMSDRLFSLAKRYYTAMLQWVKEMRETDMVTSLSKLLEAQFREWAGTTDDEGDSLSVSRHLWEAYRGVGLEPIRTKPVAAEKTPKQSKGLFANGGYFK
ncbi:hypothetical protein CGRA01v4_02649 [Colletotrichum graminicola]|uniref:Uncharacterized protein n=1 Tax=Colletotrichum graminicola (strain M1.001 / M2 / FGSC 10212) TaxID=645133 RepID=E3Q474_COLGM|nr:uncharacterized protein GLRG_00530 [Colletotrichum graminicola M1.001]EFQ25386.1 hypothetical protein GLRG_00530 [Colletotrichum graminicola M1.001]WDK11370.1 hypothetical protein CGRA01v4_02649 [Colletotrichum graminicola]